MTLIELVRAAYRDAVENGYDLAGCSVREIAYDLLECDAVIEATHELNQCHLTCVSLRLDFLAPR